MHFHGMVHVIPRIGVHLWLISVLGGGKVAICQCSFICFTGASLTSEKNGKKDSRTDSPEGVERCLNNL